MENTGIIVIVSLILLCLVIGVVALLLISKTRTQMMRSIGVIHDLHVQLKERTNATDRLKSELQVFVDECNQTLSSQNINIDELKSELQQYAHKIEKLTEQDPTVKMYTKATQMVDAGESVEEIMEACGLPRAEVEVLRSMRKK